MVPKANFIPLDVHFGLVVSDFGFGFRVPVAGFSDPENLGYIKNC